VADGIALPASNVTAATDDAGAAGHVQIVKLAIGADGSATVIGADVANGLDVDVTRVQGTVGVDSELPAAAALTDADGNPTVPGVGAYAMGWTGSVWHRLVTDANGFQRVVPASGVSNFADGSTLVGATPVGAWSWNGATWDRVRVVSVFKTRADAAVTAGTAAALWTPTTGKKFRLMRGQLALSVAGEIILKDATTEILRSPKLQAGATWTFEIGNGRLSSAANNVLNVDVSATGNVGGWVAGTEE
jgi:hypothetical protein